jgi:integrase/recombinase XerD
MPSRLSRVLGDKMDVWKVKYFNHLKVLGYSPETILSHQWRLRPFWDYLKAQGVKEPKQITSALVRNYQTFLFELINAQGKQNNVSYRNNLLETVKRFLRFLNEEGLLDKDPGEGVDYAIEPKRLPRFVLSEAEMRRLLNAPDKHTVLGYRDKTILEVFYTNGIRRSELINLKLTDIDLEAGLMRVNAGKGNKDRVVPIGKVALRYLKHYIKDVRPLLVKNPNDDHVFLSERGRKICKCMLGLRLKRYVKKAGIEKDISVHTLRATCATHCLRGKSRKHQMHPRYLMELLGHSSMEALNPYLSVSIVDLKEAHNRCHPREKDAEPV